MTRGGHRHTGIYYMAVTNDEFELPVYLAFSAGEMAAFLGIGITSLYSIVSRERNGISPRKKRACRVITLTDEEIGAPDEEEE